MVGLTVEIKLRFQNSPLYCVRARDLKPGSHLCDKHNTSDISISISTRKKEHVFFSCAWQS